jgi:DNA segregation ATPase FtsK/SpoIIIE, S-DNA-T family
MTCERVDPVHEGAAMSFSIPSCGLSFRWHQVGYRVTGLPSSERVESTASGPEYVAVGFNAEPASGSIADGAETRPVHDRDFRAADNDDPAHRPLTECQSAEPVCPSTAEAFIILADDAPVLAGMPAEEALLEDNLDLGYLALYDDARPPPVARLMPNARIAAGAARPVSAVIANLEPEQAVPETAAENQANDDIATAEDETASEADRLPVCLAEQVDAPALVIDLPKVGPASWGEPAAAQTTAGAWPYQKPSIDLLAEPPESPGPLLTEDILEETAGHLEKVIRDFGVKGEVIHVHPGPVVTLYELEPAPGIKSSRVIALSDDIARSMSAVSARVAVIPGRNAIGIELPNETRETVYLRELLTSGDFETTKQKLPLCLGKTIGGEPVIADLARMPHLLVAGTTGSGKSVAINTMILSLLYRFKPEECRLIMVDPKMLELSVYDGIPHLLTPVVTDPKKAIIALRWAVREMEERYKKMSKLGVRNIDGFNARVSEATARGEVITRTVQTGFDKETGQAVYEDEIMDLDALPYIVVIVDEMADLMMVAGKEIEGAIQRLAQMARAAGIHVILATQRPSVDVITGTIKANFPTRISFQVTSKIDSRTILGEMGAEQLLGQGDMLYMAGGGRITRVHGPFCSDEEVEKVVAHLKRQGRPQYLEAVTADDEEDDEEDDRVEAAVFDQGEFGSVEGDLYDQAVSIVLRHKKASTSYIQRRLQIGYNRAASIMERMEKEGVVGPANHAGKRDILLGSGGLDDD